VRKLACAAAMPQKYAISCGRWFLSPAGWDGWERKMCDDENVVLVGWFGALMGLAVHRWALETKWKAGSSSWRKLYGVSSSFYAYSCIAFQELGWSFGGWWCGNLDLPLLA
jgi:hypothetical protein